MSAAVFQRMLMGRMTDVLISLGGNEGNVPETFRSVLTLLGQTPGVSLRQVSAFAATAAVVLSTSPASGYLNAAVRLECGLSPEALLDRLQDIEARLGRVRERRWGPRTIDLDLLFFGREVITTDRLRVPHPAAWYRRFVLDPLMEIAPEFRHPEKGRTVRELYERLLPRPLTIGLVKADAGLREQARALERANVSIGTWNPTEPEPTFLVWCGDPSDARFSDLPLVPRVTPWPPEQSPAEFLRVLIDSAL